MGQIHPIFLAIGVAAIALILSIVSPTPINSKKPQLLIGSLLLVAFLGAWMVVANSTSTRSARASRDRLRMFPSPIANISLVNPTAVVATPSAVEEPTRTLAPTNSPVPTEVAEASIVRATQTETSQEPASPTMLVTPTTENRPTSTIAPTTQPASPIPTVTPLPPTSTSSPSRVVVVRAPAANVRSSPQFGNNAVGIVYNGDELVVVTEIGPWYLVRLGSRTAPKSAIRTGEGWLYNNTVSAP